MDVLLLFATPIITLVLHLGTGLFILRRSRLNPPEKLLASLGISGIVVYLVGFIGYLLDEVPLTSYIILSVSIICLGLSRTTIRSMAANHQVRKIVFATACLMIWAMVLMSLIRCYSGALWYGDWFEHYERTQLFARANQIDVNHRFLNGLYDLPARPPLQNVVAAIATAPAQTHFDSFVFAMTTLNVLIAPAGMLLLPTMARRGRRAVLIYAALLALSPMFVQNATFAWTKLYAGFYALTGLYFYLRAFRQPQSRYLLFSALFFAAGTMVHYSIVPYAIVLLIPLFGRMLSGKLEYWERAIIPLLTALLLISTWVVFSVYYFGFSGTIYTNTTITDTSRLTLVENLIKIARNLRGTFVPTWSEDTRLAQGGVGYWRDRFFLFYQTTLPLMLGIAGICLFVTSRFWRNAKPSSAFWIYYIATVSIIGVMVHGGAVMFGGLAHVGLTPLAVHGIGVVAIALLGIRDKFWLRLITLGYLIDAVFGILIHWFLQSRTIPLSIVDGVARWDSDPNLTMAAYSNLILKKNWNLLFPLDHWPMMRWPLLFLVALTLGWLVMFIVRPKKPV